MEVVQQLHVEHSERKDDPIKSDVTEKGGDQDYPGPALIRYDSLGLGHPGKGQGSYWRPEA